MAKKKQENAIIEGNLDPKHWVEKSDPLVLMRTVPFSLGELKILDTYISRINAGDDTRRTVVFTKEEYAELMGLSCVDYRTLKANTKGLLGKVVELQMPDKEYLQFVLFEQARYHKDEYGKPIVELTCTNLAKDLFFCIEKYHYFKYALENVISLTRKASYLLYLYILTNRYRGEWEIKLDELRDTVLDCKGQESYQEYKIFKNRVFDPAVKEVNQKTDCKFSYSAIKRGRKIVAIRFLYRSEIKARLSEQLETQLPLLSADNAPTREKDQEYWNEFYGSELIAELAEACQYEFSKAQMDEIFSILTRIDIPVEQYTQDLHWGRISYLTEKYAALNVTTEKKKVNGDKPIRDRYAYFKQMLEQDTSTPLKYS